MEGGGATLIVTPAGESVLVDTGFAGGRDAGRIHKSPRRRASTTSTTSWSPTTTATTSAASRSWRALMPIGTLYEHGIDSAPEAERAEPALAAYRAAKVGRRVVVKPGDEVLLTQIMGAAPVRIRFLGARQQFVAADSTTPNEACAGATDKEPDPSDNANSVVLRLDFGRFGFFDGGDLTWNAEGRLVCPADRVGGVDVYQSDHHGLDSSNNPALLATLRPTVVVFNNGPRKGGEKGSIAAASASKSVQGVYQVHRSLGEGALNTTPERIANLEENCAGHYLKLSVEPSGKSYTVSVPSDPPPAQLQDEGALIRLLASPGARAPAGSPRHRSRGPASRRSARKRPWRSHSTATRPPVCRWPASTRSWPTGPTLAALAAVVERALDEVDRIDRLMSHYRPESPLSRLNREAALGPVRGRARAVRLHRRLPALQPRIRRRVRHHGRPADEGLGVLPGRRPPARRAASSPPRGATSAAATSSLDRGRRTVRFDQPGVELDLGGIAKGYAVDRAVGVLASAGVAAALVSAGGSTIYALGAPPGRKGWEITIEDPLGPRRIALTVLLKDRALSVAGSPGNPSRRTACVLAHHGPAHGPPGAGRR